MIRPWLASFKSVEKKAEGQIKECTQPLVLSIRMDEKSLVSFYAQLMPSPEHVVGLILFFHPDSEPNWEFHRSIFFWGLKQA